MVISIVNSISVNAAGSSDNRIDVPGDSLQTQLQSNIRTTFCFRQTTQLTIYADVDMDLNLNCENSGSVKKDFVIEIEGAHNLQMTMTCTGEENQLGLMDGNILQLRNRNTYRYQEGFCVSIECEPKCDCECKCQNECQCICECQCQEECDCICECLNECQCVCNCEEEECFIQARLKIKATNQNQAGSWAYYNENDGEWVVVPSIIEEGYLTAETDHFSTWTVLIPTSLTNSNTALIVGSAATIAVIGVIIGVSVIYLKKRKV
ncbi:MAG: hypothetical protein HWN81_12745 [Candidatus Lokiarchaeota archaeon]|nr:hypothetical protein [Candidatus Lokiarchaeota archaeon]